MIAATTESTRQHISAAATTIDVAWMRERQELVEEHRGMVEHIARSIYRRLPSHVRGFDEDDLISVGMIGLLEAHRRFDVNQGTAFRSYAEFRIRGTILDEIRRHDFFSRRLRQKATKIRKVRENLQEELGREPTPREMASALEMSLSKYQRIVDTTKPYRMVDAQDEAVVLESRAKNAEELIEEKGRKMALLDALKTLSEREQLVLDLGFNKELTGREIAEILEVSEGRVSQIKSEAIRNLRRVLQEKY